MGGLFFFWGGCVIMCLVVRLMEIDGLVGGIAPID